jgi:hypothetical protein
MVLFINPIQENQGTLLVCSFIQTNVQNYRKTHSCILEISHAAAQSNKHGRTYQFLPLYWALY